MNLLLSNGFRSNIPPGWKDHSTISLVGPVSRNGFAANLVVTRQTVPSGTTATEFGQQQLEEIPEQVDNFQIEDQRSIQFNGYDLFQSLHRLRVGEQSIKQVQTYLVASINDDQIGLVITGSASPEDFDQAMPHFKDFVESFELLDESVLESIGSKENA